ncbi:hypothetical protein CD116_10680 [Staphylococcus schweitzeri]|uniref:Lipoprotein n=1 Tax=Staphylococcus schweitzeri TaxID=1654388 RepID=A0A2K4AF66_9STAP|nr:hypothetical protein [Staphylococcus schweitzeri]MBE2128377.1 hypothetical protein [Staphylococcus schweitzeri]PNZ48753.1 hypothetical protein CD116_10680 [Staphylococcus schweitzeri]CDR50588.1 lipoprotein [Staphylococcus schweitzeri]CDR54215.1 lipoprotein [Staphylococcus schweitzeri]VEE66350.1 Uncharacterised protein [Staphylococcus schweitzeri]
MKFKAIVAITLSLSLLTACGANQHKENSSKSNDTNKKTQETDNTTQSNTEKQMTPQEAEDIVRNDYKARGVNEYQTLNYKTNLERSNEHEYYVEHLVRDAVGTPLKRCAIVNRHNGTIINIFDDMSEKDKEEFEAFKKSSPKYNPGMNNQAETEGESEDIQHHDIDNNKVIQNDTPDQKVDDKNDKNAVNKEEKHDNGTNNSEETKVK